MLIDDFLPTYEVSERHEVKIHATAVDVYQAVRELDISRARITRWLFRLRGIPTSSKFSLEDFLKMRFVLLGERQNEELLLGLVGRFWTPTGKLQRLNAEMYRSFNKEGFAKAAWNFSLTPETVDTTLLVTETRVHCMDKASQRQFRFYWLLIGAFSGIVRKEILQELKRNAESLRLRRAA